MLYIYKQAVVPHTFASAVAPCHGSYSALKDGAKDDVVDLLLKEQGGLCAICERKAAEFGATVEHFLPQSSFPDLQLSYHNLFIACGKCNGCKGDFLIPAYFFDSRFDLSNQQHFLDKLKGLRPVYSAFDGHCEIAVPAASPQDVRNKVSAVNKGAYILRATLDLFELNDPERGLLQRRYAVYKVARDKLSKMRKPELLEAWKRLQAQAAASSRQFGPHIGVYAHLLRARMKKLGIVQADL
jgi:uncharacterized protein (TIGR02646 family)